MIAIINYGLGNLASVKNTLDRLKIPAEITNDVIQIQKAKAAGTAIISLEVFAEKQEQGLSLSQHLESIFAGT